MIDAYTIYAASVLAANTVLRSLFGAAFPLFTAQMYDALGIHWASSVPAFLAIVCVPFPLVFYKYGAAIRRRCVYASRSEAAMAELRAKANKQPDIGTRPLEDSSRIQAGEPKERDSSSSISSQSDVEGQRVQLTRTQSKAETIAEAAGYEGNPYDIDRVNTTTSITGLDLRQVLSDRSATAQE